MTRFAVLFRYNKKSLVPDFFDALSFEFIKYGMDLSSIDLYNIEVSLGNSKKSTAQLNTCAMEIEWILDRCGIENGEDLLMDYNAHNLGKSSKDVMTFALDEMKKYF